MIEYEFGVKEFKPGRVAYQGASVYVSQPFSVNGTITSVSLNATEEHPVVRYSGSSVFSVPTSVEYYISAVNYPSIDQWVPILPKETVSITNEKLFFNNKSAKIRFRCNLTKPITVYENGVSLSTSRWTPVIKADGVHIICDSYSSKNAYTVDYFPDYTYESPWEIPIETLLGDKITNYITERTEIFEQTNMNGAIALERFPYVPINQYTSFDNKKPFAVHLVNGALAGPKNTVITGAAPYEGTITPGQAYTKNITDYTAVDWKTKEYNITPYDSVNYPVFEYYQRDNKLCFGETFTNSDLPGNLGKNHGDAQIKVTYETLVTSVRLKIILRQNEIKGTNYTPSVSSYKLNLRIAK